MSLPIYKDRNNPTFMLMQTVWARSIDPVLAKPLSQANILTNVQLLTGTNTINHLLGRKMQGWILSDIDSIASIFRSAPLNDLTLTLTASAPATVSLVVF